jgi:dihydrofolate reductase
MIAIVAAVAKNGVIGKDNDLPWYLSADLRHFKELTSGRTVIMGRKTFDSIVERLGKPLPNRTNVVVSRSLQQIDNNVAVYDNLTSAVSKEPDSFIIGGAQIYNAALSDDVVDYLYITEVQAHIEGDTFFPEINLKDWEEVSRESYIKDEKNQFDYDFVEYKRRRSK